MCIRDSYLVQPTNLNVLPESGVRTRVTALLNVLKTSADHGERVIVKLDGNNDTNLTRINFTTGLSYYF